MKKAVSLMMAAAMTMGPAQAAQALRIHRHRRFCCGHRLQHRGCCKHC